MFFHQQLNGVPNPRPAAVVSDGGWPWPPRWHGTLTVLRTRGVPDLVTLDSAPPALDPQVEGRCRRIERARRWHGMSAAAVAREIAAQAREARR